MSQQPTSDNDPREIVGLEEILDPAEQDVRIGSDEGDDLPETPPDMQPWATEREMAGMPEEGETINERLSQEEPDPGTAYGDPPEGAELEEPEMAGGDDPDAIYESEDFLGDSAETSPWQSSDDPAEEAAIHVEDDEDDESLDDDDLRMDEDLLDQRNVEEI